MLAPVSITASFTTSNIFCSSGKQKNMGSAHLQLQQAPVAAFTHHSQVVQCCLHRRQGHAPALRLRPAVRQPQVPPGRSCASHSGRSDPECGDQIAAETPAAAAWRLSPAAAPAATDTAQPAAVSSRHGRLQEILAFCLPVVLVPLADPVSTACAGQPPSGVGAVWAACLHRRVPLPTHCCLLLTIAVAGPPAQLRTPTPRQTGTHSFPPCPQIMSLIDTICLGRMADALQLAALGPASLLLTFSNYILMSLSVGTVSLVAERLQRNDARAAATALSSSLALAAAGGALMGGTYLALGPQLLALTGADPAVLGHAAAYLRIRALALPAVVLVQVGGGWGCPRAAALPPGRPAVSGQAAATALCCGQSPTPCPVHAAAAAHSPAPLSPPPPRWRKPACWPSATRCPPSVWCWPPRRSAWPATCSSLGPWAGAWRARRGPPWRRRQAAGRAGCSAVCGGCSWVQRGPPLLLCQACCGAGA